MVLMVAAPHCFLEAPGRVEDYRPHLQQHLWMAVEWKWTAQKWTETVVDSNYMLDGVHNMVAVDTAVVDDTVDNCSDDEDDSHNIQRHRPFDAVLVADEEHCCDESEAKRSCCQRWCYSSVEAMSHFREQMRNASATAPH